MKHQIIWLIMSTLLISCSNTIAQPTTIPVTIPANSQHINVSGANYVFRAENKLSFNRFSETTLNAPLNDRMFNADKGRTCSGIKLLFKSSAKTIHLTFSPEEGANRGAEFAVLQNGNMTKTYAFNAKQSAQDMQLEIENASPGKETLIEVVLPSFCNVSLTNIVLSDGKDLIPFTPEKKPFYLALGNSITHGVGQGSASYLTYPYLLAQKLNMNYYNLAIGGAKISPAIAAQTKEMPQADIITILIGYNDMMSNNKTVIEYETAYKSYLSQVRINQPNAKIYCISVTYTRASGNEKTGVVPDDYRKALKKLVDQFIEDGDDKLYFIAGDQITTEANLRQDVLTDKVHFGIDGAAMFAEELYQIISK
ncbi:SGNH/GDSL hydrolase family protein [Labilibacter sediminis]|nr:SGNH/GDSL hydrolase family protein [Labilibacter sediminis]